LHKVVHIEEKAADYYTRLAKMEKVAITHFKKLIKNKMYE